MEKNNYIEKIFGYSICIFIAVLLMSMIYSCSNTEPVEVPNYEQINDSLKKTFIDSLDASSDTTEISIEEQMKMKVVFDSLKNK